MKIRFIKEFNGISKGTVLEIADHYGESLISKKIAVDFVKNKAEKTENPTVNDSETTTKTDINDSETTTKTDINDSETTTKTDIND